MKTQKDRRQNGYVTPDPTISPKEIEQFDWFINEYYSDWDDYRDGFRDWYSDNTLIKKVCYWDCFCDELAEMRQKMNLKQRKLLYRRKKRKHSLRNN